MHQLKRTFSNLSSLETNPNEDLSQNVDQVETSFDENDKYSFTSSNKNNYKFGVRILARPTCSCPKTHKKSKDLNPTKTSLGGGTSCVNPLFLSN